MSAITGLDVIYNQNEPPKPGYHKIPVDLNKGAGGSFVYICYSDTAAGDPITNIQVFASGSSDFPIQNGYIKIPNDLNKGGKGRFIYLCYTRNKAFPPIKEINVIQAPVREVYPPSAEWVRIDQDCSEGGGGEFSYVIYIQILNLSSAAVTQF